MKKKFSFTAVLLGSAAVVACGVILLVLFSEVFRSVTGQSLPWWAYIVAALICALIGYLVFLLIQIRGQRFDRLLAREGFHTDKRYEANGQTLCIDFEGKRVADTYLSTKPFIRFDEIVGYRVESYQTGSKIILPDDKRFLDIVLTVTRQDPSPDHPYLYLAMFEIKVAAEDVPETPDVDEELVTKYSELKPLYDLKQDVLRILEINKSDSATAAK